MGELDFNNILTEDEVEALFADDKDSSSQKEEDNNETTEISPDNLFSDESESVGSVDNKQDEGEDANNKGTGTSPNSSFYSSIATALRDDGILPDLDDESVSNINTPEAFAEAIENQINARLDEKQRRIAEALEVGVESSEIRNYEQTLSYLDSIDESALRDESAKGENLRKRLIYQDYINRGFTETRAKRELERSISSGTDVEDAIEALNSNKEFFSSSYKELIEEAKAEKEEEIRARKEQAEQLRKSILESNEPFAGLKIDKRTRQKIYDNISKPVYKDSEGNFYTALQKYEMEHRNEFLTNLGILFTLTNGFKDLEPLVKDKVRKETKSKIRELEQVINNTSRNSDGSLRFVSSVSDDPDSKIGYELDI